MYIHIYIYIRISNVVCRLVSWYSIVRTFRKFIQRPAIFGAGTLLWVFFSKSIFFSGKHKALYPPSLSKAAPLTVPWFFKIFLLDCYAVSIYFYWIAVGFTMGFYDIFMRLPWDVYWIPLGFP